jgi:hypothetical protein
MLYLHIGCAKRGDEMRNFGVSEPTFRRSGPRFVSHFMIGSNRANSLDSTTKWQALWTTTWTSSRRQMERQRGYRSSRRGRSGGLDGGRKSARFPPANLRKMGRRAGSGPILMTPLTSSRAGHVVPRTRRRRRSKLARPNIWGFNRL